jgi:hypothetical protein
MRAKRPAVPKSEILPYVATFHELNLRRGTALSADDLWLHNRLEEIFEPRRVVPGGFKRRAIAVPLRRRARLWVGGELFPGETTLVGLRHVQLWLQSQPAVAAFVTLEIEGHVKDLWWRFGGMVLPTKRKTGLVTVRLSRLLDCVMREPLQYQHARVA